MRIFYYCPDNNDPIGGTKVVYRHVDILNAHGFAAYALHRDPDFRYTWFENNTATRGDRDVDWKASDILVIPEVVSVPLIDRYPIPRKITFNQNAYYTFKVHFGVDPGDNYTPYLKPGAVLASIVVSQDNEAYLRYVFPGHKIFRAHLSVDPRTFFPGREKLRQIAYMPRKHLDDAIQVFSILKQRGLLDGVTLKAIDKVSQEETARILRASEFFFSFGYPEGCPLPPHEAMACGALVVGYHGRGGREMFRPDFSFPVEVGDIIGYVMAAEKALALEPASRQERAERAYQFIRDTYSDRREIEDVVKIWTEISQW